MHDRRLLLAGIIIIILASACARAQVQQGDWFDVIYLNDGTKIKGTLLEALPGKDVRFLNQKGEEITISRDKILWLFKEDKNGKKKGEPANAFNVGRKEPLGAFILSFLIPGAGQFYNGEVAKGIAQLLVAGGGLTMCIYYLRKKESIYDSYYYGSSGKEPYKVPMLIGLGVAASAYI